MENRDNHYFLQTSKKQKIQQSSCCGPLPGSFYQSKEVLAVCPKCKTIGETNVESDWSYSSYFCCFWYTPCWWCWQSAKGKDFTMKNGLHKCSACDCILGTYDAC